MNIPFHTTLSTGSLNASLNRIPLHKKISVCLLIAAILCFILSLFNTVFFTSGGDISGFWVLLIGWLGFVIFQFAWYAGPLSFLAVLTMNRRPLFALLLSIAAVTLATESFIFNEIPAASGSAKIFIREFGLGFYFWYGAQWMAFCSILVNLMGQPDNQWESKSRRAR